MKVQVDSWRAIGYWVWDVKDPDDVCGICQNNYDATCAKCKTPGEGCPLLHGTCSHIFHLHCIVEWLQNHTICPMCKRPWTDASADGNASTMRDGEDDDEDEMEAEARQS